MHKNLGKKRKTTGVEFCCNAQLFNAVILNTSGRFACVQVLKLSFFLSETRLLIALFLFCKALCNNKSITDTELFRTTPNGKENLKRGFRT